MGNPMEIVGYHENCFDPSSRNLERGHQGHPSWRRNTIPEDQLPAQRTKLPFIIVALECSEWPTVAAGRL
uniref:Uncharacterized protein n=1 Tax=Romanomermis culicivorax TaxID=13658 RepID=A0A915IQA7_ROMCU